MLGSKGSGGVKVQNNVQIIKNKTCLFLEHKEEKLKERKTEFSDAKNRKILDQMLKTAKNCGTIMKNLDKSWK